VRYLLDTNVVSESRRRGGDPAVVAWLDSVRPEDLFVSALVLGEIRRGIERLRPRDPQQAGILERWLIELRERFGDRIVSIDGEIAEAWGVITAAGSVPVEDGLMAATAKVRGMVFVTRNVGGVASTGVSVLNP